MVLETIDSTIEQVDEALPVLVEDLESDKPSFEYDKFLGRIIEIFSGPRDKKIEEDEDILKGLPEDFRKLPEDFRNFVRDEYWPVHNTYNFWENDIKNKAGELETDAINYVEAHGADPKIAMDQTRKELDQQYRVRVINNIIEGTPELKGVPFRYKSSMYIAIERGLELLKKVREELGKQNPSS